MLLSSVAVPSTWSIMVGPMNQSSPSPPGPPLAVPSRSRVVDQIVEILTDAVVTGRFAPGSNLPPERELAVQLGVNRPSLRQALSRLVQVGLVESRQGSGTVVLDPFDNPDPHVMARVVHHAGPALMDDLFEVRTAFLAMAARLAAERADGPAVENLRGGVDGIDAVDTPAELQMAEMAWFAVLVGSTGNRVLTSLLRWFGSAYGEAAATFASAFENPTAMRNGLSDVVDAIESRDAAAAEVAMTAYAEASGERMRSAHRIHTDLSG